MGVKVCLRVRPASNETKRGADDVNLFELHGSTIIDKSKRGAQDTEYTFDVIYDQTTRTCELQNEIVNPIVDAALKGFHGTVFAYGQTGSGKTHTMSGTAQEPGIIPLTIKRIFHSISQEVSERAYLLRVSYFEIYRERITDLLANDSCHNKSTAGLPSSTSLQQQQQPRFLEIKEGLNKEPYIDGLREEVVVCEEDVMEFVAKGSQSRRTGATAMNDKSSRSHAVFRITIESKDEHECIIMAQLNLVDLAGSEKVAHTKAEGERLKEGIDINLSLTQLNMVISQVTEGQAHVSYRNSKLTRILQNSIGGSAKTCILCTVSPWDVDETLSTLRFGTTAKRIKNKEKKNEIVPETAMIKRLETEMRSLEQRILSLMKENDQLKQDSYSSGREEIERQQKLLENMRLFFLKGATNVQSPSYAPSKANINSSDTRSESQRMKDRRMTWAPSARKSSAPVAGSKMNFGVVPNFGDLGRHAAFGTAQYRAPNIPNFYEADASSETESVELASTETGLPDQSSRTAELADETDQSSIESASLASGDKHLPVFATIQEADERADDAMSAAMTKNEVARLEDCTRQEDAVEDLNTTADDEDVPPKFANLNDSVFGFNPNFVPPHSMTPLKRLESDEARKAVRFSITHDVIACTPEDRRDPKTIPGVSVDANEENELTESAALTNRMADKLSTPFLAKKSLSMEKQLKMVLRNERLLSVGEIDSLVENLEFAMMEILANKSAINCPSEEGSLIDFNTSFAPQMLNELDDSVESGDKISDGELVRHSLLTTMRRLSLDNDDIDDEKVNDKELPQLVTSCDVSLQTEEIPLKFPSEEAVFLNKSMQTETQVDTEQIISGEPIEIDTQSSTESGHEITTKNANRRSLISAIEQSSSEVNSLTLENEKLKQELDEKCAEVDTLKRNLAHISDDLQNKENDLVSFEDVKKEHELKISQLDSSLQRLTDEKIDLAEQLKERSEEMEKLDEAKETINRRILEKEAEIDALKDENSKLVLLSEQSDVNSAENEIERTTLETKISEMNLENEKLKTEVNNLKSQVSNSGEVSVRFQAKVFELEHEIELLKSEKANVADQLSLKVENPSHNSNSDELEDLKQIVENMTLDVESRDELIQLLKAEIEEKEQTWKNQLSELQAQLDKDPRAIEKLEPVGEGDFSSTDLEKELVSAKQEIERLIVDNGILTEKCGAANSVKYELESRLEQVLKDFDLKTNEFQDRLDDKQVENEKLSGSLRKIEAERSELEAQKSEIEAQKSEIEAQKSEIEAQKSEIEAQKSELEAQKFEKSVENCDEMEGCSSNFEVDLKLMTQSLESKTEEIANLEQLVENLNLELCDKEQNVHLDLETKFVAEKENLESVIAALETSKTEMTQRISNFQDQIAELSILREENVTLQDKIANLVSEELKRERDFADKSLQFEDEVLSVETSDSTCQTEDIEIVDPHEKERQFDEIKQKYEEQLQNCRINHSREKVELEEAILFIEKKSYANERELAQIREEFKEKEAAFASCNEQHVQKIAELTDTKNSDIDKLKNEIEMLKQQLQEATNEMKMSSDMKNDAMVYMGQLTEQVDKLQKGLETADEMRKRAESEIESKGEEIAALTDQLQKSKDESSLKIKSLNEDIANLRASLAEKRTRSGMTLTQRLRDNKAREELLEEEREKDKQFQLRSIPHLKQEITKLKQELSTVKSQEAVTATINKDLAHEVKQLRKRIPMGPLDEDSTIGMEGLRDKYQEAYDNYLRKKMECKELKETLHHQKAMIGRLEDSLRNRPRTGSSSARGGSIIAMGDPWASPLEEPSFIKELDNLVGCEDLQNQQQPLEENISSRRLQHASPPSSKTLKTPLPEPAQPSKSGTKTGSKTESRLLSSNGRETPSNKGALGVESKPSLPSTVRSSCGVLSGGLENRKPTGSSMGNRDQTQRSVTNFSRQQQTRSEVNDPIEGNDLNEIGEISFLM